MRPTDFAVLLTRYLSQHLPAQRNVSRQTVQSYRDTFKLLLRFCQAEYGWLPENITLAQIDRSCIESFLDWIQTARNCSASTRNQRLAALKSFFRWISYEAPEHLAGTQRVLGIAWKKTGQPEMVYLTANAVQALFAQPDLTTSAGRRDATLLALLYDTGARVQELVDLRVRDVRTESPAVVTLTGKGRKKRSVPLMTATTGLVAAYLEEKHLTQAEFMDHPLFYNRQRQALTRWGVTYVLQKYVEQAKVQVPSAFPEVVSPHVLRHSKAMHLLQAGVNLIYIRDLLGHSDVTTTEIYARADAEMKRRALESTRIPGVDIVPGTWTSDAGLMEWLTNLGARQL